MANNTTPFKWQILANPPFSFWLMAKTKSNVFCIRYKRVTNRYENLIYVGTYIIAHLKIVLKIATPSKHFEKKGAIREIDI